LKSPAKLLGGKTPKYRAGDRVFGSAQGGYATKITSTEERLRPIPKDWGFFEAAGLFVTAPTSYAALVTRAGVKKGMSIKNSKRENIVGRLTF
jgi:NADPH2:quinone reductase